MENGISGKKDKKQKEKPAEQTPDKKKQNEKQKKDKGKGEKLSPVKGEKTPAKSEKTPAKGDKTPAKGDKTTGKSPKQQGESPQKKTIEGGVIIEDVKLGNGQVAKPGKFVRVSHNIINKKKKIYFTIKNFFFFIFRFTTKADSRITIKCSIPQRKVPDSNSVSVDRK